MKHVQVFSGDFRRVLYGEPEWWKQQLQQNNWIGPKTSGRTEQPNRDLDIHPENTTPKKHWNYLLRKSSGENHSSNKQLFAPVLGFPAICFVGGHVNIYIYIYMYIIVYTPNHHFENGASFWMIIDLEYVQKKHYPDLPIPYIFRTCCSQAFANISGN